MSEFRIGIWGTGSAGKTTYLALLYQAFLAQHEVWEIFAQDDEARSFVERTFEQIFQERIFPEKTVSIQEYHYYINRAETRQSFTLAFLDAPGELFEDYYDRRLRRRARSVAQRDTENRFTSQTPQEIFDYLAECSGILIFLDPARRESLTHQRPYQTLLYQLLEDLRAYRLQRSLPPPLIALCLTKVDGSTLLWKNRERLNNERCYRENPELVTECEENCPVFQHLGRVFMLDQMPGLHLKKAVRCFLISSIGRATDEYSNVGNGYTWQRLETPVPPVMTQTHQEQEYLKSALDQIPVQDTYLPRSISQPEAIKPYHLLDPILWMLQANQRY
jgi:GTPase SAR1 family protein